MQNEMDYLIFPIMQTLDLFWVLKDYSEKLSVHFRLS